MSDTFGFYEFIDALGEMEEDFKKASKKLLEETGDLTVAEAQARTPVGVGTPNPGNLRRRMTRSDVEETDHDISVEVGNDAEYARYVEEGHKTRNGGLVKGRHMLRDGVTIAKKHFEDESDKLFSEVTKGFKL